MPDNASHAGGPDRQRIDVSRDDQLNEWSKKFDVSPDELKAAVTAVGDRAIDVQTYLAGIARDGGAGPASG